MTIELLDQSIQLAAEAHKGQRDKADQPYILHPLRVMFAMSTLDERIVAVLHDVVEDNPDYPLTRLWVEGIRGGLAISVDAITRRRGEPYDAYLQRLSFDPLATRVKLADLADNLDDTRLQVITDADRQRRDRYRNARRFLLAAQGAR